MQVQINTLTPVHIGSGIDFQGNVEYLWFAKDSVAVVTDDRKVLSILGEENIGQWIACIDNKEPLLPLLEKRAPNLNPEQLSRRILQHGQGKIDPQKVLREQLHTSSGQALLPGTSLKGALRTAVWGEELANNPELVKKKANLGTTRYNRKTNKETFSFNDSALSKKLFGKDPNHDVFRLWQIGDFSFTEGTEIYQAVSVNKYYDDYRIKEEITQQVEALPAGVSALGRWKFNEQLLKQDKAKRLFPGTLNRLRPEELFKVVNKHTRRLLENEIGYWTEKAGAPTVLGSYIEEMQLVLDQLNQLDENSCILRLGWGTGFRNMTGDSNMDMQDDDFYDLVAQLRPSHDETIMFPKTTRMVAGGKPLGYVAVKRV